MTSHQLLESRRDRRVFYEVPALAGLVEDKHVVTLADAGNSLSHRFFGHFAAAAVLKGIQAEGGSGN